MTPETSEFELHRSVKHAIIAARTAPAELPIYIIAFLPIMERAYADLLDDPAVLPLWRLDKSSGFHYHTPAEWAVHDPTPVHNDGSL